MPKESAWAAVTQGHEHILDLATFATIMKQLWNEISRFLLT